MYGRLLRYVTPYWAAFLASILGFGLYSLSNVAFVQLIGYIVDSLQGSAQAGGDFAAYFSTLFGGQGDLNRALIPVAIVLIALARGAGTFVGNYFISHVGTYLVLNLRRELFNQLLALPSAFYDKQAMGHLVAKVTFHVTQVTGAATDAVRVIVREGFTVLGYFGLMLYLNWTLTIIFLAVAPVIALLVGYAGKRFRRISKRIQDSMGGVTHVASETVQGYREVRTFGGGDYERERFDKVSQDNRRQSMKMVVTSSLSTPAIQLMVAIALAGLVWLVLDPRLLQEMTSGAVVAFITTSGLLAKPIRQLSEVNATVQSGLAAAEDIFELFDQETEGDHGSFEAASIRGEITFDNVSFSYGEGLPDVLKKIRFTVQPGETIALVGRSGSGKSTLASLIPRFYSPTRGRILIDGRPIESFSLDNLRSHIAIVTQQVTLFNDTIKRNIGYGALQAAGFDEIRRAAEKAYAAGFIEALADGYDTVVGDEGVLLSGGQRQRLAIARAFLKDAPILILDEATSALDTESERYIQAALEAVVKGRTTFLIAHRLSTIETADRIFVIDNGLVVEEGTHAELLAKNGFYASLHHRDEVADEAIGGPRMPGHHETASPSLLPANRFIEAWYSDAVWVKCLAPIAFVYRKLVEWRRHRLSNRFGWKARVPLLVIGNINVGGTGKSPLVIALVSHLASIGFRPGVVSRGYGGRARRYPKDVRSSSPVIEVGDEAVMIHKRTGCPVVVAPDRVEATRHLLERHDCDLVVSDDGLQHYRLGRDIEIAVVDGQRGLGNGLCLPAGPLREPAGRLQEVDLVVINGGGACPGLDTGLPVERMQLVPLRFVNIGTGEVAQADTFSGESVHAVAGTGHPARFFDTLSELGCEVNPHPFDDHYLFNRSDLNFGDALPVIMTEKDAVRLAGLDPARLARFWYLEVSAEVGLERVDELIRKACLAKAG